MRYSISLFCHPDGFAIAFTGRPTEVELMFLYVRKSTEGQGIGARLVGSVHMAAGQLVVEYRKHHSPKISVKRRWLLETDLSTIDSTPHFSWRRIRSRRSSFA
jgi:GNAT superfamily N-acetyltransferase